MTKKILIMGILWVIGEGVAPSNFSLAQQAKGENTVLRPVEEFVRKDFVDSLPFEIIKQYAIQGDTVKRLIDMLKEDCTPHCTNILAMLGIIGGENSADAIIEFLKQDRKTLLLKEKTDALMILGYWINNAEETTRMNLAKIKTEGMEMGEAKNELIDKVTIFINCLVAEIEPGETKCSGMELEKDSSQSLIRKRAAIIGLALTGSKEVKIKKDMTVKDYLESLLKETKVGTSSRAHIIEALEAHNGIAALGLACFYDNRSSECQENIKRFIGQK